MPRRPLATRIHGQRQLSRMLAARHPLVQRTPPPRLMLQALGLVPDEPRGRRDFVRAALAATASGAFPRAPETTGHVEHDELATARRWQQPRPVAQRETVRPAAPPRIVAPLRAEPGAPSVPADVTHAPVQRPMELAPQQPEAPRPRPLETRRPESERVTPQPAAVAVRESVVEQHIAREPMPPPAPAPVGARTALPTGQAMPVAVARTVSDESEPPATPVTQDRGADRDDLAAEVESAPQAVAAQAEAPAAAAQPAAPTVADRATVADETAVAVPAERWPVEERVAAAVKEARVDVGPAASEVTRSAIARSAPQSSLAKLREVIAGAVRALGGRREVTEEVAPPPRARETERALPPNALGQSRAAPIRDVVRPAAAEPLAGAAQAPEAQAPRIETIEAAVAAAQAGDEPVVAATVLGVTRDRVAAGGGDDVRRPVSAQAPALPPEELPLREMAQRPEAEAAAAPKAAAPVQRTLPPSVRPLPSSVVDVAPPTQSERPTDIVEEAATGGPRVAPAAATPSAPAAVPRPIESPRVEAVREHALADLTLAEPEERGRQTAEPVVQRAEERRAAPTSTGGEPLVTREPAIAREGAAGERELSRALERPAAHERSALSQRAEDALAPPPRRVPAREAAEPVEAEPAELERATESPLSEVAARADDSAAPQGAPAAEAALTTESTATESTATADTADATEGVRATEGAAVAESAAPAADSVPRTREERHEPATREEAAAEPQVKVNEARLARRHPSHGRGPKGAGAASEEGGAEPPRPKPRERRSPEEWLRLLSEASTGPQFPVPPRARSTPAEEPPPPARPAASGREPGAKEAQPARVPPPPPAPVPAPEPVTLAPSTRRFLRPLVGVDPASVRVYRGTEADAIASAHAADAVTAGDAIAVAHGHDERTPEGLGLLAHELTHVARQRTPRFVPPIVRGDVQRSTGAAPPPPAAVPHPTAGVRPARQIARHGDEEGIALDVETRVRTAAREEAERPFRSWSAPKTVDDEGVAWAEDDAEAPRPAVAPPPARAREPERDRSAWGGLPAPWEPFPDFATSAPSPAEAAPPAVAMAGETLADGGVSAAPVAAAQPAVQAAASDRDVGSDGAQPAGVPREDGAPKPDIDALARQVYDVLRRRLAVERRRGELGA